MSAVLPCQVDEFAQGVNTRTDKLNGLSDCLPIIQRHHKSTRHILHIDRLKFCIDTAECQYRHHALQLGKQIEKAVFGTEDH